MKNLISALFLFAAASGFAVPTTNFVGTIATRQQILGLVCPSVDVSWETEILQDTEGAQTEYYVGPHCDVVIANWLAASTTNEFCTYSNELFRVNGQTSLFTLDYFGRLSLGSLETYEDDNDGRNRAKITILEKSLSNERLRIKWRYYRWNNTNMEYKYRECTMTLTVTPRYRFPLPTTP